MIPLSVVISIFFLRKGTPLLGLYHVGSACLGDLRFEDTARESREMHPTDVKQSPRATLPFAEQLYWGSQSDVTA